MTIPDLEKTIKAMCYWFIWKIAQVGYFLCSALPMALYISCLFVVAIERRSTIELPIIMTVMLHPLVAIPIGMFVDIIGQYLSSKLLKNGTGNIKVEILSRLFTYSINFHLAVIAALLFYLYEIWIPLEIASNLNFENQPFNQCQCGPLSKNNITCVNDETENSFQNKFLGVAIEPFLIAFLVVSFTSHLIHSLILVLPAPIKLLHFYLGQVGDQASVKTKSATTNQHPKSPALIKSFPSKYAVPVLVITLMAGIMASPYIFFNTHLDDGKLNFKSTSTINDIFVVSFRINMSDY